jgi:hypothetical protein
MEFLPNRPLKYRAILNDDADNATCYYLHERANTWKRWLAGAVEEKKPRNVINDKMFHFWLIMPPTSKWFRQSMLTGFEEVGGHVGYTGGLWGEYIKGFVGTDEEFVDACERFLDKYIFSDTGWQNYTDLRPGNDYIENVRGE